MVQYSPLLRQQKISIFAFLAAVGSFTLGVMLPVNLRSDRELRTPPVPPSSQPKNPEIAPAPNIIKNAQEKNSNSPTATTQEQPLITNTNLVSFEIKGAINQRVKAAQTRFVQWEKERFNQFIPERFQGVTIKQVELNNAEKAIALTFDDGPWPKSTEQILDILKKEDVKATFFWVGVALKNHPEIAKKVVEDGHAIANHSWSHRYKKYSEAQAAEELDQTSALIEELTGIKTVLFRPPGGVLNNGLVDYAFKQNYANIMWSADSQDWRTSKAGIVENILKQSKPGGIVLMHDGGGNRANTVQALPTIIKELKNQGYKFVTVPELLQMADQEMKNSESEKPETPPSEN